MKTCNFSVDFLNFFWKHSAHTLRSVKNRGSFFEGVNRKKGKVLIRLQIKTPPYFLLGKLHPSQNFSSLFFTFPFFIICTCNKTLPLFLLLLFQSVPLTKLPLFFYFPHYFHWSNYTINKTSSLFLLPHFLICTHNIPPPYFYFFPFLNLHP